MAKNVASVRCSAKLALIFGAMPLSPSGMLAAKALVICTECGSFFWPLRAGVEVAD